MLNEKENPYLAKWLNDDLDPKELEALKELPEYEDYKKIVEGLEYFTPPSFEVQSSLATTLGKIFEPKSKKVIRLRPIIYTLSAAASIALLIGVFFSKITYTAQPGERLVIQLPDESSVELNAASSLSHNRFFWTSNKEITLDGEAYFKVNPGKKFTVVTTYGEVAVLGTQFNVKSRTNEFTVGCYEGKVQVATHTQQQEVLERGEGVSLKNNNLVKETITGTEPLWKNRESLFNSAPLRNVLDELERQYKITFRRSTIDQEMLYTGGFNYDDLQIALEAVLVPMGIEYVINGKVVILSTSQ